MKVSVLIPSRNERLLAPTVEYAFAHAAGDVEVIAVVDGPTDHAVPAERPGLTLLVNETPRGMRGCTNQAAQVATGEYFLKLDSHCRLSEGYDELLQAECEPDWVVMARRNELADDFTVSDDRPVDYFYMSCPWTSPEGFMRDCRWDSRIRARLEVPLDETMTICGSMWFMPRRHFTDVLGGLDEDTFGPWCGEPPEVCCKTWLTGGRVMVNKRVIYAHHRYKHERERGYHVAYRTFRRGMQASTDYWAHDRWPGRGRDFEWLVDHFWPLPQEHGRVGAEKYWWPSDWRDYAHAAV